MRIAEWSSVRGRIARQFIVTSVAIRPRMTITASISTIENPARRPREMFAVPQLTPVSLLPAVADRQIVDVRIVALAAGLSILAVRPHDRLRLSGTGLLVDVLVAPGVLRYVGLIEVGLPVDVLGDEGLEAVRELAAVAD